MMIRTIAIALLAIAGSPAASAVAAEADGTAAAEASALARQTLATHLKTEESELQVESVEPRTWNDSGLGCGKQGTVALQVITEGYAVTLRTADQTYRVHVAGSNAVVCNQPLLMRKEQSRPAHARGLDEAIEKARADLATRLQADPDSIRLYGTRPQQWRDNTLDCPRPGEAVVAQRVNGFKLFFRYKGRLYTYHSDLSDVRACPPIESQ